MEGGGGGHSFFFALVPTFLDELARKRLLRRLTATANDHANEREKIGGKPGSQSALVAV